MTYFLGCEMVASSDTVALLLDLSPIKKYLSILYFLVGLSAFYLFSFFFIIMIIILQY